MLPQTIPAFPCTMHVLSRAVLSGWLIVFLTYSVVFLVVPAVDFTILSHGFLVQSSLVSVFRILGVFSSAQPRARQVHYLLCSLQPHQFPLYRYHIYHGKGPRLNGAIWTPRAFEGWHKTGWGLDGGQEATLKTGQKG